ncbi:hypothetical protein H0H93_004632 [Arthromyces matolae]|nr:hypothetical protein H0H93_004632 [Arthromyces matolae]
MAKATKKSTTKLSTRPITDFFKKNVQSASKTETASVSSSLRSSFPIDISSTSLPSATKSLVTASDVSSPPTPRSAHPLVDSVEIVSPKPLHSQFLVPAILPVVTPTHSAAPSRAGSLSPHPRPGKSPNPVFDSDSDMEKMASSVYILRSPGRSALAADIPAPLSIPLRPTENLTLVSQQKKNAPRKRQRLFSPEPTPSDLVPTSQSDELEVVVTKSPRHDPLLVKQNVEEWRNTATSFRPEDTSQSSLDVPFLSVEEPSSPNDIAPALPPMPATPQALDPTTKAERMIAEIKARVYAQSLSNKPESPMREFKEELSDSDDDDLLFPDSPTKGKGEAIAFGVEPSTRYLLRPREVSPSPSVPRNVANPATSAKRTRVSSTFGPVPLTAQNATKSKAKSYNPLDDLLREKKRDDHRGRGSEALRLAEEALANRDAILANGDEDDFTDEAAARKAIFSSAQALSSPSAWDDSNNEDDVNDQDRERLLGAKQGKAVANLLNNDRVSRWKEMQTEKHVGVPFWGASQHSMDVDEDHPPKLHISTSDSLLSVLQDSVDRNDVLLASLLLNSGVLSSVLVCENPAVISYLCNLALSSEEGDLTKAAMQMLSQIWRTSLRLVPGISFTCILSTLTRLGAHPSVLNAKGWILPSTSTAHVAEHKRDSVLYRLFSLINESARQVGIHIFRRISSEEIPDFIMAMILVANDPSTSADLQLRVVLTVNTESNICSKVLMHLTTLRPVNKAHIIGIFGSGCGRTQRIARWIAHGVITDQLHVPSTRYCELPPIHPLLDEFMKRRSNSTVEPGKFEMHDNTDFVDMSFYVRILSIAVTDVLGYVREERKKPQLSSSTDGTPQETPLVLLRTALETLHGRISDIRATHLDRSRTKAELKELSLRIYYQRQVAQQSFKTLHTYFPKHKKPNGGST